MRASDRIFASHIIDRGERDKFSEGGVANDKKNIADLRLLLYICKNYRSDSCKKEIIRFAYSRQVYKQGIDQEKLNEICRTCESRYFTVSSRKCPVCGSKEFNVIAGPACTKGIYTKSEFTFMEYVHCKSRVTWVNRV
jgi:Zn finger protein HypA/HybF involved in hydrogenase expression